MRSPQRPYHQFYIYLGCALEHISTTVVNQSHTRELSVSLQDLIDGYLARGIVSAASKRSQL